VYDSTSYSPLTADLNLRLNVPVDIEITTQGIEGGSDISVFHNQVDTSATFTVVGLYPNTDNDITVKFFQEGQLIEIQQLSVATASLSKELPRLAIDVPSETAIPGQ